MKYFFQTKKKVEKDPKSTKNFLFIDKIILRDKK